MLKTSIPSLREQQHPLVRQLADTIEKSLATLPGLTTILPTRRTRVCRRPPRRGKTNNRK